MFRDWKYKGLPNYENVEKSKFLYILTHLMWSMEKLVHKSVDPQSNFFNTSWGLKTPVELSLPPATSAGKS